jgi:hypothetical protein
MQGYQGVAGNQVAFIGGECGAVAAAPDDQRSYNHACRLHHR